MTTPNVEDVEPELSLLMEVWNDTITLEAGRVFKSHMFICLTIFRFINSIPGYLALRYENLYSQNTCTKIVHGSPIHNSSKMETTQMSNNRRMDKHCGIFINLSQEKKWATDTFNNMNQSQKHSAQRSETQEHKPHDLHKFKNRLS